MPELKMSSPFTLPFGENQGRRMMLAGLSTGLMLKREAAPDFLRSVTWARVLLTWDENDHNVNWAARGTVKERWEGVILHPSPDMPSFGGPTCGPFNKRNELLLKPSGTCRFYHHPADGRIHLYGADQSWLDPIPGLFLGSMECDHGAFHPDKGGGAVRT
jgi:hypothetical protein